MAHRRKPAPKSRQGAKAPRKPPLPPAKRQARPKAPLGPRKPTPQAHPPAPAAKPVPRQAPKPASKPLPRPASGPKGGHNPHPKPAPKGIVQPVPVAASQADPLDTKPTAYIPGAYIGWIRGEGDGHTCIAYERTDYDTNVILCGQPIRIRSFSSKDFDQHWQPLRFHGKPYPVEQAVSHYLKSFNGWTDKALTALRQLQDGKPVDINVNGEDIEDILGIVIKAKTTRVRRQGLSKEDRKRKRRERRKSRLAAMTPKQRQDWLDRRTARRKARRAAKGKA